MKKILTILFLMSMISCSSQEIKTYSHKDPEYLLWCSGDVIVFIDRKGTQHICEKQHEQLGI